MFNKDLEELRSNTISEMKTKLGGTDSRVTEAEQVSDLEDRMMELVAKNRIKKNNTRKEEMRIVNKKYLKTNENESMVIQNLTGLTKQFLKEDFYNNTIMFSTKSYQQPFLQPKIAFLNSVLFINIKNSITESKRTNETV